MIVPQWIIEKKRDRQALTTDEIEQFIAGYTNGDIPDYQMAAMAMAIYLNGMTFAETAALTSAMMNSGDVLDTAAIAAPIADKHSTGGIGDKVSLILAPLAACSGLAVPMISGRGLGITGGTLDKMESIAGYRTDLSEQELLHVVDRCGCSIVGQTATLAPADKKLYALRDVTATVPSIPLITASIMCKKLAEGLDVLVLDVKWGKGAFMKTQDQARELAANMVEVGARMDKKVAALLTDMNEPLGTSAGNALEVAESIACLRGEGSPDLMEVTLALTARMLMLTGKSGSEAEALDILDRHITSGAAFDKFKEMVILHGGDPALIDQPDRLPAASIIEPFSAPSSGYVAEVDADRIGRGALLLGAGRTKTDDRIDPAVGISGLIKSGAKVNAGDPLALLHANDPHRLAEAKVLVEQAFTFSETAVSSREMITETILPQS